jgi:DNA processing protein
VHQLIRARGALLVNDGQEVLEAVAPTGAHTLGQVQEPARPRDLLTAEERQVLDAVPVQRGADAAKIARTAGMAPARVDEALEDLLRGGFVERAADRWRLRRA